MIGGLIMLYLFLGIFLLSAVLATLSLPLWEGTTDPR